jgi:hypothetical protein
MSGRNGVLLGLAALFNLLVGDNDFDYESDRPVLTLNL